MSLTQAIHEFIEPDGDIQAAEIFCDSSRLNEHFGAIDLEIGPDEGHCISQSLYSLCISRLTGDHKKFLNLLECSAQRKINLEPVDYKINLSFLDDLIFLSMYYHQILFDLWIHPYNKSVTKDIALAKKDLENIKSFLDKIGVPDILTMSKHNVHFRIVPYSLELKSYKFTTLLLNFLHRIANPEEHNKELSSDDKSTKMLALLELDITPYAEIGRGKNFEVNLTQKFIWLLYTYLKKNDVIISKKAVTDRTYHSLIADVLTLTTLPDMVFNKESKLVWNYCSEDYDKLDQMKRIDSWIYNYQKKI